MIIQEVDACDLHAALDYSVDFGASPSVEDWEWKLDTSLCRGYDDMLEVGQNLPICVSPGIETPDSQTGEWCLGNGHHRLSVAMFACAPILVLFSEDGDWGHYAETSG